MWSVIAWHLVFRDSAYCLVLVADGESEATKVICLLRALKNRRGSEVKNVLHDHLLDLHGSLFEQRASYPVSILYQWSEER